jgi:hypothetical protein
MKQSKIKSLITPKLPKVSKAHIEKKLKDQITLLNDIVKIRLASSPIHGVGVFTMRDIKRGDKLYTDIIPHQFDLPYSKFNKLDKDIREILLGHFPLIVNGSHFMFPVTKFSAFLNHSDDCNYDAVNDVALKDIPAGTEVTEDYRLIKDYKKIFAWLNK